MVVPHVMGGGGLRHGEGSDLLSDMEQAKGGAGVESQIWLMQRLHGLRLTMSPWGTEHYCCVSPNMVIREEIEGAKSR